MGSLTFWWTHLSIFSQIFWAVALFGTVVLIMQLASMFLGLENIGGHDTDGSVDAHDMGQDHDSDNDHSVFTAGLKLFTLRNLVAFVCMFGWTGLVMIEYEASKLLTCIMALAVGCFSMIIMALLMKALYGIHASGNISEEDFVGEQATVYIPIPEKGKGFGKINFNMGGKLEERIAISTGPSLSVGTTVRVLSYSNNTFTVAATTN